MFDTVALKRAWHLPHLFFQGYLTLVLVLFFFGPWPWRQTASGILLPFLITAQLAIWAGYSAGWSKVAKSARVIVPSVRAESIDRSLWFFQVAFWVTLVLLIPTSLSRSGALVPDVVTGLSRTGVVYNENYERLTQGNAYVVVEYVRMIASPALVAFFPLLILFWGRIPKWQRVTGVALIAYNIAISLSVGVNKAFADVVILLPWLIYLARMSGSKGLVIPRVVVTVVFLALFIGFLIFFGRGQEERSGNVGAGGVFYDGLTLVRANVGYLGDILSNSQRIIYESLTRYLTSGYYGLGLSFNVQHPSTYGVGNSMFLARNMDIIFSTDYFSTECLPGQMEQQIGFPQFVLWHSIYTWLASDVGYLGSIIVVGIFSYLFSVCWGRALLYLDHRYISLSILFVTMFYYIPANNQIFQTAETCIAFFILFAWLASDRLRGQTLVVPTPRLV